MKEIFKLIFLIRYVKSEKVKITIIDLFNIWRTYIDYKVSRFMKFKEFYISVVDYSIDHMIEFKESSVEKVYELVLEKNNEIINGYQ